MCKLINPKSKQYGTYYLFNTADIRRMITFVRKSLPEFLILDQNIQFFAHICNVEA